MCRESESNTFFSLSPHSKHLPALMNSPSEDSKNEVEKHTDVLRKRSTHGRVSERASFFES